jgi:hypothetical protein
MALRVIYDSQEDRMRLTLYLADGEVRAFWVARRQWLGLLHTLGALLQESGEEKKSQPQAKKKQNAAADGAMPVLVQRIKLRRLPQGAKIVFVGGSENVVISMEDQGLRQLRHMLQQQAERADWDVDAAMRRLNAQSVARAAMRKASRSSSE